MLTWLCVGLLLLLLLLLQALLGEGAEAGEEEEGQEEEEEEEINLHAAASDGALHWFSVSGFQYSAAKQCAGL